VLLVKSECKITTVKWTQTLG